MPSCLDIRVDGLKTVNPSKKCIRDISNSIEYLTYLGGDGVDKPIELVFDPKSNIISVLVKNSYFFLVFSSFSLQVPAS